MTKQHSIFVIMPFNETFNQVFNEGISTLTIPGYGLGIRRADTSLKGLRLVEHVHRHIEDCDFCIADITGTNPNVMYEIGFAQALKKEVVIIKQAGSDVPIDISDKYIFEYQPSHLEGLTQQLTRAVLQAIKIHGSGERHDFYPVTCFRSRSHANIEEAIAAATSHIYILETNLSAICDNYLDKIIASLNMHPKLQVRVLTLDPESYFVARRAEQLGVNTAQHRQDLQRGLSRMVAASSEYSERFILRTYDNFPTQIAFVIDEIVYLCTMAMTYRSRDLCTFRMQLADPGAEKSFVFHFDTLWKEANPPVPTRIENRGVILDGNNSGQRLS